MKNYYIGQKIYPDFDIEKEKELENELRNKYKIEIGFFANENDSMSVEPIDEDYYTSIDTTPGDLSFYRNGYRVLTIINTFGEINFYGIGDDIRKLSPIYTIPLLEEYDFKLD